ncbi:hypothetical protein ACIRD3_32370 [Kitasatospora sp. NPDC093550]|uniref:hypothetical protein n=1 Tax=Kitasatospora sp. NPDC093550 TaxID=3364089 RepID=UPI00380C9B05
MASSAHEREHGIGPEPERQHLHQHEPPHVDVDNTVSGSTINGPLIQAGVVHVHVSEPPTPRGPAGLPVRSLTDPTALNVRRSITTGQGDNGELPTYVTRAHDAALRAVVQRAAQGTSATAVLVGDSSTGKTRACWEALRELPPHWRVWHPLTLRRLLTALRTPGEIGPYTVVWLDEAQSYLLQSSSPLGEEAAAALREQQTTPGHGPVLILATLWPEYWLRLDEDRHRHARALFEGRSIRVPNAFTRQDLAELARVAEADPKLTEAAEQAQDGEITQYLGAAPLLLERYETASSAARALMEAAMDLRRLGHGVDLPWSLLAGAATAYLPRNQLKAAGADLWEQAIVAVTTPCRGVPGPLAVVPAPDLDGASGVDRAGSATPLIPAGGTIASIRAGGAIASTRAKVTNASHHANRVAAPDQPWFRLADYLEQHGRRTRGHEVPGAAFWETAVDHCSSTDDAVALGTAALIRLRLRHAEPLYRKAHEAGNPDAVNGLAEIHERIGRLTEAEHLARQAASRRNMSVFQRLARMRARAGAPQEAARLYQANAEAGSLFAPWDLAWLAERNGDPSAMDRLLAKGRASGDHDIQIVVPWMRMGRNKHPTLDELVHDAAARGSTVALWAITTDYHESDLAEQEPEQPEESCRRAADAGRSEALEALATRRAADDPQWARLLRYGLEPDCRTSPPWS